MGKDLLRRGMSKGESEWLLSNQGDLSTFQAEDTHPTQIDSEYYSLTAIPVVCHYNTALVNL